MKIRLCGDTLPAVQYEIENIKDKKLLVKFHNKLEYINGEQLEIMLTTKFFDKIHSKKSEMGTICIFELRITRGKRSNLRALLCGIEESKKTEIKLYVTKVWEKDTQKIPQKIIKLAITRFKELIKLLENGGGE